MHSDNTRTHPYPVNRMSSNDRGKPVPSDYICIRCNTKGNHFAHMCYALEMTCNNCKVKGHVSKACRKNINTSSSFRNQSRSLNKKNTVHQNCVTTTKATNSCCPCSSNSQSQDSVSVKFNHQRATSDSDEVTNELDCDNFLA